MNLDILLESLEGVRRSGSGWKARCPAHEDRIQSLSINEGDDGIVLLYCHTGCTYQEITAALSESGGERVNALARSEVGSALRADNPPLSESASPADLTGFAAIYDYEDENGKLLFKVCRTWREKKFFQCRPDESSPTGFFWGLGNVRRVPYRLPRVLGAVRAGHEIHIVEGEKDVHAIEKLGGVGTCNPMGASRGRSKWMPEWNHFFEFADVIVVADKDEAGWAHAQDIACQLEPYANSVVVVEPREGKDTYDHMQAGYRLEHFV